MPERRDRHKVAALHDDERSNGAFDRRLDVLARIEGRRQDLDRDETEQPYRIALDGDGGHRHVDR